MNYRHSYHAGNFADVFKHIVLLILIQSFLRKDTPFCYLETHAGTGSYDLRGENAQKSPEFLNGVAKLFQLKNPPAFIDDYLRCIHALNPDQELRFYPGSPYFASQFIRPHDRMLLTELHPEDAQLLKQFFRHTSQVAIHHQDGYQSLKALLPPKERRGLILIDPPYEKPQELTELPLILAKALQRFETGVYAVWYPIKERRVVEAFYRELKKQISRPFSIHEFCPFAHELPQHFNGCGMLIINPPWQVDEKIELMSRWLRDKLKL